MKYARGKLGIQLSCTKPYGYSNLTVLTYKKPIVDYTCNTACEKNIILLYLKAMEYYPNAVLIYLAFYKNIMAKNFNWKYGYKSLMTQELLLKHLFVQ